MRGIQICMLSTLNSISDMNNHMCNIVQNSINLNMNFPPLPKKIFYFVFVQGKEMASIKLMLKKEQEKNIKLIF